MGDFQSQKAKTFDHEANQGKAQSGEGPEPIAIVGMGKSPIISQLTLKLLT